jgi:REG-2-like HAD superfamily hydrolase
MMQFELRHGRALLLDVGLTLLHLAEPVEELYHRLALPFGISRPPAQVLDAFAVAMNEPVQGLRYHGDGRGFWRRVVIAATGVDHPEFLERVYNHYGEASAWRLAPDARACIVAARATGAKVGVVSNWDLRLRRLLTELQLMDLFDEIVVSAEEGIEKPNPAIFHRACERLGVRPEDAVHVGDSEEHDVVGARDAGCLGWWYGPEVNGFASLAMRLGLNMVGSTGTDD